MKVLVTGGGGFLGGAMVRALVRRGDQVVSLQRGSYPDLVRLGVETHAADVADTDAVIRASRGCEVVFHVAGKTGVWGPYREYHHANVAGTDSVIHACRSNAVPRLLYTSTPSVVFDGGHESGIDESQSYPGAYLNHYQATKALAEQRVLAANGAGLTTAALRPHLIWGPGDPHLVARIVDRARRGRLRLVRGGQRVDSTYIDNAVDAHLMAADTLSPDAACAGRCYFISNGEPLPIADLINRILQAARLEPVRPSLGPGVAYALGAAWEFLYRLAGIRREPLLTRFVARQLSREHWFDIGASRRDFGYQPRVGIEEGLRRLALALESGNDHDLAASTS